MNGIISWYAAHPWALIPTAYLVMSLVAFAAYAADKRAAKRGAWRTPESTLPTLRRGSKGEYVTLLQTKLIQRGYNLEPFGADGSFGAKTEAAVVAFQKNNNLVADGIVGKNTWNALTSGETPVYTVTIPHLSKSVADEIVGKYGGTMTKEGD